MAKDPAMLWYWNDWQGGTMTMTRHLKGCYMDLLYAQFNNGPLSIDQVKTVLGTDQAKWTVLSKKFKREVNSDGIEVFSNERMVTEKNKREEFCNKQTERVLKRWQKNTTVYTTVIPFLANENENKEEGKGVEKGEGFFLNGNSMDLKLTNVEINSVKEYISIICKKDLTDLEVKNYWQAFKINNFSSGEWYRSHEKLISHFRHSLKNELLKNKKTEKLESSSGPPLKRVN